MDSIELLCSAECFGRFGMFATVVSLNSRTDAVDFNILTTNMNEMTEATPRAHLDLVTFIVGGCLERRRKSRTKQTSELQRAALEPVEVGQALVRVEEAKERRLPLKWEERYFYI